MILILDAEPFHPAITELYDHFTARHLQVVIRNPADVESASLYYPTIVLVPRPEMIDDLAHLADSVKKIFPKAASALLIRPRDLRHRYFSYADRVYTDFVSDYSFLTELFEVYGRKSGESPHISSFGLVDVDFRDYGMASFAGYRFPISQGAWAILRYLVRHAPRTVPAEELIANCFLRTRPVKKNTISAHISSLNRLLSTASEGKYTPIIFVHGKGYAVRDR